MKQQNNRQSFLPSTRVTPLALAICTALSSSVIAPVYAAPGDAAGVEFQVNDQWGQSQCQ